MQWIKRNTWKALWFLLGLFAVGIFYDWSRYNYQTPNPYTWVRYDLRTGQALICYVPDARTTHAQGNHLNTCDVRMFVDPLEELKKRVEQRKTIAE